MERWGGNAPVRPFFAIASPGNQPRRSSGYEALSNAASLMAIEDFDS